MRKIRCIIAGMLLLLSLCACGKGSTVKETVQYMKEASGVYTCWGGKEGYVFFKGEEKDWANLAEYEFVEVTYDENTSEKLPVYFASRFYLLDDSNPRSVGEDEKGSVVEAFQYVGDGPYGKAFRNDKRGTLYFSYMGSFPESLKGNETVEIKFMDTPEKIWTVYKAVKIVRLNENPGQLLKNTAGTP